MKSSTLIVLGLGVAIVAYVALAPKSAAATPAPSGGYSPIAGASTSREAAERAAVDLAHKAGTAILDYLSKPSPAPSAPIDYFATQGYL